MSAQRHGARHQRLSKKAQIESLLAAGKLTTRQIAAETGRSLDYVQQIQGYNSRTNGDMATGGDCDKHLELVLDASPRGFPFCVVPPSYRVRA